MSKKDTKTKEFHCKNLKALLKAHEKGTLPEKLSLYFDYEEVHFCAPTGATKKQIQEEGADADYTILTAPVDETVTVLLKALGIKAKNGGRTN